MWAPRFVTTSSRRLLSLVTPADESPPAGADSAQLLQVLVDVACAMTYLHTGGTQVVHRDLKSQNGAGHCLPPARPPRTFARSVDLRSDRLEPSQAHRSVSTWP